MTRILRTATLLTLLLPLPAAAAPGERRFDLSGFDAVALTGSDDVTITAGPRFGVSASGDPRAVATLRIAVRGGVLHVGREPGSHSDRGATVAVTMPALRAVTITGSGDVDAGRVASAGFEGRVAGSGALRIAALRVPEARVEVAGSGDAIVEGVEAGSLALAVRGSGDLRAAGRARQVSASLAGSGDIDASGLDTPDLSVSLAGSGDVRARASGRAQVNASGTGDVTVSGGARCTVTKSRTADVRCG